MFSIDTYSSCVAILLVHGYHGVKRKSSVPEARGK